MNIPKKISTWLFPTVLALFILEVLTLPLVVSLTYAGTGDSPEHIITYRSHSLKWDEDTTVREDGSGVLTLFDAVYQNTDSDNGDHVLAPGTEGDDLVRLKNEAGRSVTYTAVLYTVRSTGNLPAAARMDGDGTDTDTYPLPEGVTEESVVRALTGSLGNGEIADFALDWYWIFEESATQDEIDTALGNSAARGEAEDILMGIYIVIEDEGEVIPPSPPMGDDPMIYGYATLFAISAVVLILLIISRRREKNEEENC